MTRPTILDSENVALLDLTPSGRAKPAWAAAAEKAVAQQMASLTASVMRHAGDDDPTAWDEVRKYVEGLERTCANRDAATKELYDVCVSHATRADAAEARIAELEKRLADADRLDAIALALSEAIAQRDAAFEMSKCECGTDEACRNLVKARATGRREGLSEALRAAVIITDEWTEQRQTALGDKIAAAIRAAMEKAE